MRIVALLLLLLSAPAQAAVFTFRSDPLTTGDGAGCADPGHVHCGDIVLASFAIDDATLAEAISPQVFSFRAWEASPDPGGSQRSRGLLGIGLWLHSAAGVMDLSHAILDPRLVSSFEATVGPGGALHAVSLLVWHDRPDLTIGMGGVVAGALFDDPRARYVASGQWERAAPRLVAAPLPPAGLLLAAGVLSLAGLRRRTAPVTRCAPF